MEYGPTLAISKELQKAKYLGEGETFPDLVYRLSDTLSDSEIHRLALKDIIGFQRFLPAGRVQSSVGAIRETTALNCFVSQGIEDSMEGILDALKDAALTMKLGGGIGYDFSTLRPRLAVIKTLDSKSSGPVSFMDVFDAMCGTISSAGHRRGAQMGVLRVDHPDIEEFVRAKKNDRKLTNFNISVGVTDEFMVAVIDDKLFDLKWNGETYKRIRASNLWDEIMRATWDWAEPGVLFLDTINEKNNLRYCETISATNPCGEQPLPPYGACLLGSFNVVKYAVLEEEHSSGKNWFNLQAFRRDIPSVVRAMDNVIENTVYPLERQELEALSKRRIGLGITGFGSLCGVLGYRYGSSESLRLLEVILSTLRDSAYLTSSSLAVEKGSFPYFDATKYLDTPGTFANGLPLHIKETIRLNGIRNSHLLSIAPTGTISLCADNVSSGIEPVFAKEYTRKITHYDGSTVETVKDWAWDRGFDVTEASDVSLDEHLRILATASALVDSGCSKTCNVGSTVSWKEFKDVYVRAWEDGCSGITTYRSAGKRFGILNSTTTEEPTDVVTEGSACYVDPATGIRTCDS